MLSSNSLRESFISPTQTAAIPTRSSELELGCPGDSPRRSSEGFEMSPANSNIDPNVALFRNRRLTSSEYG